jgi:proline iminopeptidase
MSRCRKLVRRVALLAAVAVASFEMPMGATAADAITAGATASTIELRDGYVDTGGAIIYYVTIGKGQPLMLLHGGPGSTHEYFLPYLLPLAKTRQLVLIDQRGSGRSQRFDDDHTQYNLSAMAKDVEAVRVALNLGKMDLLGHSFGGILAQAVAINHPAGIRRLILASTGSSAARVNADFKMIKDSLDKGLRARIDALEQRGIIGPDGAQLPEYRRLADEAEARYSYFVRPPAWDSAGSPLGWDVLNQVWGAKSDFHIDGSLAGFDFTPALRKLKMPALIIYGDHDMLTDATPQQSHEALAGSVLVKIPRAAHMTMVDQNTAFIDAVARFLDGE